MSGDSMHIQYNAAIPMSDGTVLSAAICRPDNSGTFPTMLIRTCYTKWSRPLRERAAAWVAAGYVFIIQDVRGRGDSDGRFYPLIHERGDGNETIDWIARQPWSDGSVVMTGGSYAGWTQLYPACDSHPALKTVAATTTPPDPDRSFPRDNGMLSPAAAAWLASLDGHTNQNIDEADIAGAFEKRPIVDFDQHIGRHLTAWRDWTKHPPGSAYWREQSYQKLLLSSTVPMLHISGWYDDCLAGATENFAAMSTRAIDPDTRTRQRLVVGPWMHNTIGKRHSGSTDYGETAEIDMGEFQRNWFDAILRGEEDESAPVRLFVMGRNEWIEEQSWPIARTLYVPYYLHSNGHANSRLGDGILSTEPPAGEPPDSFEYNPSNPIPYAANFDWMQVGGPDDFAEIELRRDLLVYTSAPLTEPLLICGPLMVKLFAATSAPDTDWTAKVLDVHPDGRAIRLNDGAVRARFRHGGPEEHFLTPGKVEEYQIDCWSTCIEIPVGHCLRVEIASSAFGKIDVNLNGGGPIGQETVAHVAMQTVFHDRLQASHLLLPVVENR